MCRPNQMRVLVGCECSGIVREAFRAKGFDAWSCDLLAAHDNSPYHLHKDLRLALGDHWDAAIFHPPCTYLCSSGLHWNGRIDGRAAHTEAALEFVRLLLGANIPHIALENPVGCISTNIRPYEQKIQPWQFGHDASKGTCLWLKGLPKLRHTKIIPPHGWSLVKCAVDCVPCPDCGEPYCEEHDKHYADCDCIGPTMDEATYRRVEGYEFATLQSPAPRPVWGNQTPSGQNKLGPSKDRWMKRSQTYTGIAIAMANQWGDFLINKYL